MRKEAQRLGSNSLQELLSDLRKYDHELEESFENNGQVNKRNNDNNRDNFNNRDNNKKRAFVVKEIPFLYYPNSKEKLQTFF